jgi:hypothetical protein
MVAIASSAQGNSAARSFRYVSMSGCGVSGSGLAPEFFIVALLPRRVDYGYA